MDSESATRRLLAGRRVLITRARRQAQGLAQELERHGAKAVLIPTVEILPPLDWTPADLRLRELGSYDWLIFTSANGVEYFLDRLDGTLHDRAEIQRLFVAAIGPATRRSLENHGVSVALQPRVATALELANELIGYYGSREKLKKLKVLLPTTNLARQVLPSRLAECGVMVDVIEVYRTGRADTSSEELRRLIKSPRCDDIVFASPSALHNLETLLGGDDLVTTLSGVRVLCIGTTTAQAAGELGLHVDVVAEDASVSSIIKALSKY